MIAVVVGRLADMSSEMIHLLLPMFIVALGEGRIGDRLNWWTRRQSIWLS